MRRGPIHRDAQPDDLFPPGRFPGADHLDPGRHLQRQGELKTAPFDLHAGQARLRITWQGGLKDPSASSSGAVYVIRPGDGWPGDEQLFLSQEPGSIEQAFYPDASGPRYPSIEPRDNVRSWAVLVEELR
jgi:hypothetical protein